MKIKVPFYKMHGTGNDFVVIDHRDFQFGTDWNRLSKIGKFLCNRNVAIGADGVLLLESSERADFKMRLFQPDGSEAEMCGNGSRCIAKYAYLTGIVSSATMTFETIAGILQAEIIGEEVKVQLTPPKDLQRNVEVDLADGRKIVGDFINTGVPHFVIYAEKLDAVDVYGMGREIRFHRLFQPAGTNVNFYRELDEHTIKNRTYERGVEQETLACGTGSTAAAIISGLSGRTKPPVKVITRSGLSLTVYFDLENITPVYLQGNADVAFVGEIELDLEVF